jgi:hypothetical protein
MDCHGPGLSSAGIHTAWAVVGHREEKWRYVAWNLSEKVDHRVLKNGLSSESESVIPRIVGEKIPAKNQDRPDSMQY